MLDCREQIPLGRDSDRVDTALHPVGDDPPLRRIDSQARYPSTVPEAVPALAVDGQRGNDHRRASDPFAIRNRQLCDAVAEDDDAEHAIARQQRRHARSFRRAAGQRPDGNRPPGVELVASFGPSSGSILRLDPADRRPVSRR
jgi:hypothetical protein